MKPTILLVEDKPLLAEDIVDRLHHFGYKNVAGPYDSGEQVISELDSIQPDIAILDINLKGQMDGIELAKKLNERKHTPVIYLTQLQDDATIDQAASTFPAAFLNKPFTNGELKMAVVNAINLINGISKVDAQEEEVEVLDDRIFIKNGRGRIKIMLDDILWIQSGGGETSAISVIDRYKEGKLPYTLGFNLNKLQDRLAFYYPFVRCSRFHIINLKRVKRILDDPAKSKNKKVLLLEDTEIPVGDIYRKNVMGRLKIV